MVSAQEYEKQVWNVMGELTNKNKELKLRWETIHEAKHHKARITQVQKQLRLIKKEIGVTKKTINAAHASESTKVGKGIKAGLAAGFFGKKNMGKVNAVQRDNIRRNKLNMIQPYDNVIHLIDNILVQLDGIKLELDGWVSANS